MVGILKLAIPFLLAAIGILILLVLVREAIYSFKKRSWQKMRSRCLALVGNLNEIDVDGLLPLAVNLKQTFPLNIIESVLDEYARTAEGMPRTTARKLANIYDHIGLVEKCIKAMQESKSWQERAEAADKLGHIAHPSAALPMIAILSDPAEDREVKSVVTRALGRIRDERAIAPLVNGLGLPDPSAGQPLADVLVQFGEKAVDPLIDALESSEKEMQRFWAARILGALNAHRATRALLNALNDHSDKVRTEAALSIGRLQIHEGVSPLGRMLIEDPVSQVREAAAEALGKIGDDRSLSDLKLALKNYDYTTRRKAMEAMEKMGEKALPFFLDGLSERSKEAVAQAAAALERIGVVAKKVEELGFDTWQPAFELLSKIAKAGVVETLTHSLKNPKLEIRIRLCRILAESSNSRSLEALIELARDDDRWVVRLEALVALVRLASPKAVPVIIDALSKEDETFRERLLIALEYASVKLVDQLADAIISLVQDPNQKVRIEAVKVLGKLQNEKILPTLLASLADAVPEVRVEAAEALGGFTDHRPQITEALVAALLDNNREVRIASVKSLGKLEDPEAINPLAEAFERADEGYRDDIAAALASMPAQKFYQLLDTLMGLPHSKTRAGVAWTLGLIGDERSVRLLGTFLKDPEPLVRASTAGALGNFRKKENAPLLLEYLGDPNERVRAAVVNALGKSGDPSAIANLLPLLRHESDAFVCQRVVLAMGCLATGPAEGELPKEVRRWMELSTDENSKAAGLVGLALLKDRASFQEILKAVHDKRMRPLLGRFLKGLPQEFNDSFFAFLSLSPNVLWQDKSKDGAEHYIHLLESSREVSDRLKAIEAMTALGAISALPAIEHAFSKDPMPSVRAAALGALVNILDKEKLAPIIIKALQDPSDEVRAKALSMLTRSFPEGLEKSRELLIPSLDSPDEYIRGAVAGLLARLYRKDWRTLADQLLGTEKKERILGLIETLGKIGDPAIAPLFVKFTRHGDPDVRIDAVTAASESGALAKNDWIRLSEDPQEAIRMTAIRELGKEPDAEAMDTFEGRLEDPSVNIRAEIANILGKKMSIGEKRPLDILNKLVRDEDPKVRAMSLLSLYHLNKDDMSGQLAKDIGDIEKEKREVFLDRLEKEGIFKELLVDLKHGQGADVRKRAVGCLSALDLPRFAVDIVRALKDPAGMVRLASVKALGQIRKPEIDQAVRALAQDPVGEVREAVKRWSL
ncbi:MAG: HEAT repeat domain-containing protein [Pseudomonadota bacterium]